MRLAAALAFALAVQTLPARACGIFLGNTFPESRVELREDRGLIAMAQFTGPTTIYDHHILGRDVEPEGLFVFWSFSSCRVVHAGAGHVFEDIAPRFADIDGDGFLEIVVVRTSIAKGAQLAVYALRDGKLVLVASTPYIGQPHRWLAPAGIADFDGDGRIEIAFVDRPHLLGELVFARLEGKTLREVARLGGVSNHRIGDKPSRAKCGPVG
jgi:FG-GAP-like repeat